MGGAGGSEGGRGCPSTMKKNNVINIHISLNLRRMKKENDIFVILMQ